MGIIEAIAPFKTDAPLIVDSDAVLSMSVTTYPVKKEMSLLIS
jgi:hypothetical protein